MKIFLSGAMTCQTYDGMSSWRKELKEKLINKAENYAVDVKVYSPIDYYDPHKDIAQTEAESMDFELDLVLSSDLIIVNTDCILGSPGTITECALAWRKGIPVIGFGNVPKHPYVRRFFRRIEDEMDELVDYVGDFYFTV